MSVCGNLYKHMGKSVCKTGREHIRAWVRPPPWVLLIRTIGSDTEAIMVAFGWMIKSVALEERLLMDQPIAFIHNNLDLPNPNPRCQPKTPLSH